MRYPCAVLAALAALLLLASPAAAVTVHVDVQNDEDDGSCVHPDCSLREAVKYAPVGATVDVPAGDYAVSGVLGELVVPRTMTIDGASSSNTTITGAGGTHRAVHDTGGPVTFRDLTITGGADGNGFGGGILDESTEALTLDRVRVTQNAADISLGTLSVEGGGGVAALGPVTMNRSLIDQNSTSLTATDAVTSSGGGGIIVVGGTLTAVDSEVSDNHVVVDGANTNDKDVANNGGGGIYVEQSAGGSLVLTRSTVAENTVGVNGQSKVNDNGGGGIYLHDSSLTAVNSTVSQNRVAVPSISIDNGGGGIFVTGASASLLNLTISDNKAQGGMMDAGGALYREGGSISARNTIIARNTADSAANCFGSITSQGHNIEDKNTCGLGGAADRKSTPIALGSLKLNGGPTRTQAIFAGGPAFDTATKCPATDQRGVKRPAGAGCDRGAFELAVPTAVTGATKGVRTGRAHLLGSVIPNGKPTTYFFQFGKTKAYGAKTASKPAGAGSGAKPASGDATGLKPATIYHYRLVARNALGTTRGCDRSFITHMKMPSGCVKDRKLTVPLGRPRGARVVLATAVVGKNTFATAGGSDVKRMKLKDLPAQPFRLKIAAKLGNGRKVLGSRRYKPC